MADADTEVTLPEMQAAIAAQIAAAFPVFALVEFDRDDEGEDIPLPACLLEFIEAEPAPANDAGTGQWPALARFEARIIMNARRSQRTDVKVLAVSLSAWLNLRRFAGVHADPCQVIACEPDEFAPSVEKFRAWRIEWVIPAMFGNSVWGSEGGVPASFFSFVPEIGAANVDSYVPVDGAP